MNQVVEKNGTQYQVTVNYKGQYRLEKLNKQRRVDRRAKQLIIDTLDGYRYVGYMVCGLWKIESPAV